MTNTVQHIPDIGGGTEALANESCEKAIESLSETLLSEHKKETVAKVELITRSNINPMFVNKLFIRKHGMCLPSLSQIQERIDIIFDGNDSIELEKWQIKGVEWEDEHCKEV